MMIPTISASEHPFHRFVSQLSQQDSAFSALTELRNQSTFNANIILYLVWFGFDQHGRLQKPYLKAIFNAVYPWRNRIILGLNQLLKMINESNLDCKVQIKRMLEVEIHQAERVEQQLLADTIVPMKLLRRHDLQKLSDSCCNIVNYFKFTQTPLNPQFSQLLISLLQCCFPGIPTNEINQIFKLALAAAKIDEKVGQLRLENI